MKWLFATYSFPWPIVHGSWLRVYHLARGLAHAGEKVCLLSRGDSEAGVDAYRDIDVSVSLFTCKEAGSSGTGRTLLSAYLFEEEWCAPIAKHCREAEFVVLFGARMMQYAPEASAGNRVIVDMVDDPLREHYRRLESPSIWDRLRMAKLSLGQKRYERKFRKYADAVVFVSEADCKGFLDRNPGMSTYSIPNGVDTEFFKRPDDLSRHRAEPSIVFLGNMANPNNERAARYLVEVVGPALWKRIPEARIVLVGAEPTPQLQALSSARVTVTGSVPDVREYLWSASVVAIPMVSGTGIKNKVLEAWAASAPVVATPLAVEGISQASSENCMICEDPVEFAQAIEKVLKDPEKGERLGQTGRKTVECSYSWEGAVERLMGIAESPDSLRCQPPNGVRL